MLVNRLTILALLVSTSLGCGNSLNPQDPAVDTKVIAFDNTPKEDVYPKPMVPVTPSDSAYNWPSNDLRYNYPSYFAITDAPESPVTTPAEWENKQALLIGWTGNFPDLIADIVRNTQSRTDVTITYDSVRSRQDFYDQMAARNVSTTNVKTLNIPNQTIWMRDYGPLGIVKNGKLGFVDLRYYPGRTQDDAFPEILARDWNINNFRMPLDLEGGNFMADGQGTCYATKTALTRNTGASEFQIRAYFKRYLGCENTILLHALYGEGTGHIDMFAKIVTPRTIMLGQYNSGQSWDNSLGTVDSVNAEILETNAQILSNFTFADGSKLNIVRLPMPTHSDYNFRTYVNSQMINGVNMIPIYQDDTRFEQAALNAWRQALPSWEHVAVDATDIITWAGAVHCILMEIPQGQRAKFQANPDTACNHFDCFPTMAASLSSSSNSGTTSPTVTPPSAPSCPSGETKDCAGNCAPSNWLADGYCDDGAYAYNGTAINFDCSEFNNDQGDCAQTTGVSCESGEVVDCQNHCAPASWVGDGYCDDGAYQYQRTGEVIYLNCATYQNDKGDCVQ